MLKTLKILAGIKFVFELIIFILSVTLLALFTSAVMNVFRDPIGFLGWLFSPDSKIIPFMITIMVFLMLNLVVGVVQIIYGYKYTSTMSMVSGIATILCASWFVGLVLDLVILLSKKEPIDRSKKYNYVYPEDINKTEKEQNNSTKVEKVNIDKSDKKKKKYDYFYPEDIKKMNDQKINKENK